STWFLILAFDLPSPAIYLNFVFPIAAYWLTQSPKDYLDNVTNLFDTIKHDLGFFFSMLNLIRQDNGDTQ
ncbi:MAG: hypothetical protein J7L73_01850, partial [Anaerolineales bacterium]|nr:hypothetical protein [Anaerolineales bacterium]